jgi:hypothetical protein
MLSSHRSASRRHGGTSGVPRIAAPLTIAMASRSDDEGFASGINSCDGRLTGSPEASGSLPSGIASLRLRLSARRRQSGRACREVITCQAC